jgi:hypothetical protein
MLVKAVDCFKVLLVVKLQRMAAGLVVDAHGGIGGESFEGTDPIFHPIRFYLAI